MALEPQQSQMLRSTITGIGKHDDQNVLEGPAAAKNVLNEEITAVSAAATRARQYVSPITQQPLVSSRRKPHG